MKTRIELGWMRVKHLVGICTPIPHWRKGARGFEQWGSVCPICWKEYA